MKEFARRSLQDDDTPDPDSVMCPFLPRFLSVPGVPSVPGAQGASGLPANKNTGKLSAGDLALAKRVFQGIFYYWSIYLLVYTSVNFYCRRRSTKVCCELRGDDSRLAIESRAVGACKVGLDPCSARR
jgi:hypothetical protein